MPMARRVILTVRAVAGHGLRRLGRRADRTAGAVDHGDRARRLGDRPRRLPWPSRDRQLLGVVVRSVPPGDAAASRRTGGTRGRRPRHRRRDLQGPGRPGPRVRDVLRRTWPSAMDADGSIAKAYRVVAPPQSYFIDRQGILRLDPDRRGAAGRLRQPVPGDREVTAPRRRGRRERPDRRGVEARRPDATGDLRAGAGQALRRPAGRGRPDLTVARGELFALLGPNGAGKTTTVEILEGYRQPDAGSARVLGLDPSRDGRRSVRASG